MKKFNAVEVLDLVDEATTDGAVDVEKLRASLLDVNAESYEQQVSRLFKEHADAVRASTLGLALGFAANPTEQLTGLQVAAMLERSAHEIYARMTSR